MWRVLALLLLLIQPLCHVVNMIEIEAPALSELRPLALGAPALKRSNTNSQVLLQPCGSDVPGRRNDNRNLRELFD